MKVQLFSIEHAPRTVPIWPLMMDDLCQPPAARVARVLGLSVRTIRRYNATGHAPRHVCLAVFWLTSWGRHTVNAQAINDARLAVGYVDALRAQVRDLGDHIVHLRAIGDFGTANEPGQQPTARSRRARVR